MSKRIYIIGYKKGLGAHLYEYFSSQGYKVDGDGLSDGYNINSPQTRQEIINKSRQFDVIIINARAGMGQADLLFEMYQSLIEEQRRPMIITIGSRASVDYLKRPDRPLKYDYYKLALEKMAENFSLAGKIRVCHLNLDYLKTSDNLNNSDLIAVPKIELDTVATHVNYIINLPPNICLARSDIWASDL